MSAGGLVLPDLTDLISRRVSIIASLQANVTIGRSHIVMSLPISCSCLYLFCFCDKSKQLLTVSL